MIISEKEVHELMLVAHCYLRLLEEIHRQQPECLSECGVNNKRHVADLLQSITRKQSVKDVVVE
jgi:predicted transcriptional regulator